MKNYFNKRVAIVVFAGAVIGSLVTTGVFAAIPNSNTGVISACRDNVTGALRAIDTQSGATCSSSERVLRWSSQIKGELMLDSLRDADLSGARLQYLNLQGVDFRNSQFNDARLTGSNLKNADFSGAYLTGGVSLDYVKANGANFSASSLQLTAAQAILTNTNFSHADIITIDGGDFSGSNFTYSSLGTIHAANLTNTDFRNSLDNKSYFEMSDVNLSGANFSGVSFVTYGSQFTSVIATNTNFSNASFENTIFNNTNLSSANLTNTTWTNVTCPDGTNSDNNGNTCLGHLVP